MDVVHWKSMIITGPSMTFNLNEATLSMEVGLQVRISVKFLKGWPVVRRVRFCFASVPVVTMSYKPFSQSFPDVSLFRDVEKYVVSF